MIIIIEGKSNNAGYTLIKICLGMQMMMMITAAMIM
jgi:hypothetical protein